MPLFGAQVYALYPGDLGYLFAAEQPASGAFSVAFALGADKSGIGHGQRSVGVSISYATQPSAVSLALQQSNDGVNWTTISGATSTNVAGDFIQALVSGKFVRLAVITGPGVNMTATITNTY